MNTAEVFAHGALARDGEWWWRPVAELLSSTLGITSTSVRLPSCGEDARPPRPPCPIRDSSRAMLLVDEPDPVAITADTDDTVGVEGHTRDSFADRFVHDVIDVIDVIDETTRSGA